MNSPLSIAHVELRRIQIPFKAAFQHAQKTRTHADAVIVVLTSADGRKGYGEIVPRAYVTGETMERVLDTLGPAWAQDLLGRHFSERQEVIDYIYSALAQADRNLATYSGFELALLDLAGQTFEFSLASVLSTQVGPELPMGAVIGLERSTHELAHHCAALRFHGRRHIKVKIGHPEDRKRLEIIGRIFKDVALRLDANGAYKSRAQALEALQQLKNSGVSIASIEQPNVPSPTDQEEFHALREATGLKFMADESLVTLADAHRLATSVDIFNIRLGKCGGLLGCKRMVEYAREVGVGVHLGTLVGETGILSRAAEIFGRALPGFECLDGKGQNEHLLIKDVLEDPTQARTRALNIPGLGVQVSDEKIAPVQISAEYR